MRYFYVQPDMINGDHAVVTGPDARHIKTVLRMQPGDIIELLDGSGDVLTAKIRSFEKGAVTAVIQERKRSQAESPLSITVAQGLLKDKKMEALIRPLSELGVSALVPFIAERSVAVPDAERMRQRVKRWETIAKESMKQCRRGRALSIHPFMSLADVMAAADGHEGRVMFWEEAPNPMGDLLLLSKGHLHSVMVLIGPEGGFTAAETQKAKAFGFQVCGMGPRILKSQTAAVVAAAIVQHRFGDMGGVTGDANDAAARE